MHLTADAPLRLFFRLDLQAEEASLEEAFTRLRLRLGERACFDEERANASGSNPDFDAEVLFTQFKVPDLVVGRFYGPQRADLALSCLAGGMAIPSALVLQLALPDEDGSAWRHNARLAALRLLTPALLVEDGLSYWSALAERVLTEGMRDPDLEIRRLTLELASGAAPSSLVAALDDLLARETDREVIAEFQGYRDPVAGLIAGSPAPRLEGSSQPRMAFAVLGTAVELAGQGSVLGQLELGPSTVTRLRSGLLDARIDHLGRSDESQVGCLFISGPDRARCAWHLAEVIHYFPTELAETLARESRSQHSRGQALLALGFEQLDWLPDGPC